MRIGLVVPGFSADAGDWCIPAVRHLARSLATRDHVSVVALRYPYTAARYQVDGAEVIALGGALSHRSATLSLWRRTLDVLRQEDRHCPFDVLHAFWATESGLLAAMAGRLLRIPTLVSLAGGELVALRDIAYGDQRIAWERLKVSASLQLATAVSAGSHQLAERAHRRYPSVRLHVAPLGVDQSLFKPDGSSPSGRVVHVGTLTPVKDQATLLRAFSLVRRQHPDACLDIVGSGPLAGQLEHLASDLGLKGSVRFMGDVDHAALPAVYRGARTSVVSSRHEAQSMVALEGAACGIPVVGTRVGVLPELTDAVVPVGDHVALCRAIEATLACPPPPAALPPRFTLPASTARFHDLYTSLATP
jgi:glycosyltransferase involved in cell wall biosynthesis